MDAWPRGQAHVGKSGISGAHDAQQHRPSRGFDGDGHESGNAGGRALVGVRRPLMKRDGGDFE